MQPACIASENRYTKASLQVSWSE